MSWPIAPEPIDRTPRKSLKPDKVVKPVQHSKKVHNQLKEKSPNDQSEKRGNGTFERLHEQAKKTYMELEKKLGKETNSIQKPTQKVIIQRTQMPQKQFDHSDNLVRRENAIKKYESQQSKGAER